MGKNAFLIKTAVFFTCASIWRGLNKASFISRQALMVFALTAFPSLLMAQIPYPQIKLYPDSIPNSKPAPPGYAEIIINERVQKVTDPTLIPFFPEKPNGTAVIICPGGGYEHLAIEKEGYAVAKKFNELGITAFVLKYRLPSDNIMLDQSIGPLQDAQRAIQMVRERAKEWHVDTSKVGIAGFSAGGHLAASAGTHYDYVTISNKDNISLRPDFMILIYPVISFGPMANVGSMINLLGKNPSPEQRDFWSPEKHVTPSTPPAFLVQAEDDKTVMVQNSLMFFEALLHAGVKAEIHIYQAGGHGFGLNNKTTKDYWFDRCRNWLQENGFCN